ncbi:MAG: NAD(P)H-dependent oxidoreductase subunit E [Chloroflexota bacterium]|nr:NAD(P)H-dependent oxidoreductase subunit E [Chloroflexota bacterium]
MSGRGPQHFTYQDGVDLSVVEKLVEENRWRRGAALSILEGIQHHFGWVSPSAIRRVADLTDWSTTYLYGVITYYDEFRIAPPGAIVVSICNGSACALNGEKAILEELEQTLGIEEISDTSPDDLFTQNKFGYVTDDGRVVLRKADCIGCCQLAPVVRVGEEHMVGPLTPETTGPKVRAALQDAGIGIPESDRGQKAPGDRFRGGNL